MAPQRYEIEAWLGDNHGITEQQIDELVAVSGELADRYPEDDDVDLREAGLTAAYRTMVEGASVVDELAGQLAAARLAEALALAGLGQAARSLIPHRLETESGFGRRAGVDRMTVRSWLGKR